MKIRIPLIISSLMSLLVLLGCASRPKLNLDELLQKTEDEILTEVAKLPDKDIDLGAVALVLAKGYYPEVDIRKYLHELDKMAKEVKQQMSNEKEPERIIQILNNYLYETKNFESANIISDPRGGAARLSLSHIIEEKTGDCIGLSVLYLALAERLKLPFYGVGLPDHMFVRYDNGILQRNIEVALEKGIHLSKNEYINLMKEVDKRVLRNIDKKVLEGLPESIRRQIDEMAKPVIMTSEDIDRGGYFVNLSKKDVIAHIIINRASVYADEGKYNKAKEDIEKTISLNPTYPHLWGMISNIYSKIGDQKNALKYIDEAIKKAPQAFLFYHHRGFIYAGTGELAKALSDYNTAIGLNPNDATLYYGRGAIYDKMKEYDRALVDFDKAIELYPESYLPQFGRAVVLFRRKEYEKSLESLGTVIKLRPKYAQSYYIRGLIYKEQEESEKAIKAFEKYLELESNSPQAESVKQYIEELKAKIKEKE